MATIRSIFKMQDNATKTFDKVANAIDGVITRADELSNKTSTMGTGISSINPSLTQAISKYQNLITKQDSINERIDLMRRQEKLLLADLNKEKNSYSQNEKSILRVEQRLMNLRAQKEKLTKQSDALTNEILEQAVAVNQVEKNTRNIRIPQEEIQQGFAKWQTAIITFNQSLQLIKTIAGGIGKVMNFSDSITLSSARLGLINDGLQTTEELQNKIFKAAERSRGSYNDLAKSVSKLGLLAPDAFKSNDEMIAFSEMMQKSFKVSGAAPQEISSATYQLTQAMAAGKLQGDEFRSITENAPMLADAIAKYMGKSKGELKKLSREGLITADIIKAAMFSAADDINAQYENMPRTFADVTQSIKNTAQLEFQGVANKISDILNNDKVIALLDKIEIGIRMVADVVEWAIDKIAIGAGWVYDHLDLILLLLGTIAAYMVVSLVPAIMGVVGALALKTLAWAAAHWQILTVLTILTIGYSIFKNTGSILTTLAWVILMVAGAFAIWNVVQWALNGALYSCPIVWIIVLVLALVAAIYLIIDAIVKATGTTNTALGIIVGAFAAAAAFVYNIFVALINLVIDMFGLLWNYIGMFVNFFANVFTNPIESIIRLFTDFADIILGLLESLASAIDTIFGSDLSSAVRGWRNGLGDLVNKTYGEDNKVMEEFDSSKYHLGRWEYGDAWESGLQLGNNLANSIESFEPSSMLDKLLGDALNQEDKYNGYDYNELLDGNGNLPVSIEKDKTNKEVNISDEDLKMLKDIATREYMLNYKHIVPNVSIQFGDVKETADVNEVKDALKKMMEEELAELYVVEEA